MSTTETTGSATTARTVSFDRQRWLAILATYRIWPVLLLLVGLAAAASGGVILRPSNLLAILFIAAPTAIAASGQTLVILTGGIDLSVASIWILGSVVAAGMAASGWDLSLSVAAALGIGLVGGALNGALVALLRLPPLITTLGSLSIGEGIARIYTGNSPILSVPAAYKALGGASFLGMPIPTLILTTVVMILVFVMHRMAVGKQVYAVGGNVVAARYAGLGVTGTLVFVYTASGVLAALAGLVQSAYVQEALTNVDMDTLFLTIGGVVVGGTSLTGGSGRVVNSVGGVLVIVIVENMMNILGISPLAAEGVLGLIVLLAVYLNVGFDLARLSNWFAVQRASPRAPNS